jgi:uncharacterized protein
MSEIESKEVEWKVNDISVHGTITRPKSRDARSAIVFVAGSGPTDRDWCSPLLPGKNGSGKLLAEYLASQGFLTLRYDKLGSGPHAQENVFKMIGKISMQSHVDELSGAVKTIDADRIFALTISEGAIHALNYQLQSEVKFKGLVLTGAPGRSIGQVARGQIVNQLGAMPKKKTIITQYDVAIASFVEGNQVEPDPALPEGINQLLLSLNTPVNLPFTRELWTYNPSEVIGKIKEPILVVIGKKDIQVDWQADGKTLETAAAGEDSVSFVYPENSDHVLKFEEAPREKLDAQATLRYNVSDRKLDPEATNAILYWLIKRA